MSRITQCDRCKKIQTEKGQFVKVTIWSRDVKKYSGYAPPLMKQHYCPDCFEGVFKMRYDSTKKEKEKKE